MKFNRFWRNSSNRPSSSQPSKPDLPKEPESVPLAECRSAYAEAIDDPGLGRDGPVRWKWKSDLGYSASVLAENAAWLHIVRAVTLHREKCIRDLIDGREGATASRAVLKFIDELLRTPDKMVRDAVICRAALVRTTSEATPTSTLDIQG